MKEINAVYAQTLQRIQELDTELTRLKIKKETLEELGAGRNAQPARPGKPPKTTPAAASNGQRAPKGSLPAAVLALLAKGGGSLTAAQIRSALQFDGYPHALGAMHVRKVLKKMAKGGSLESQLISGASNFSIPRKSIDAR